MRKYNIEPVAAAIPHPQNLVTLHEAFASLQNFREYFERVETGTHFRLAGGIISARLIRNDVERTSAGSPHAKTFRTPHLSLQLRQNSVLFLEIRGSIYGKLGAMLAEGICLRLFDFHILEFMMAI